MSDAPAKNPRTDELLRLIFDSATDFAIFTMDPNGIVTSWNTGAERVLGYDEREIQGTSADITFVPEERGHVPAEERRTALLVGRAEDERWQLKKGGVRFWASGLVMPLTDRTQGFVKIFRDRSDHHRMEEQLRQNEELFRLLATNIPQLVFRCRSAGERTWGSPQWSLYTGLTLNESLEYRWLEAVHPADREHVASSEWVGTSTDIHGLRLLQDKQKVLLAERHHRTRNLLSIVQAIARQSRLDHGPVLRQPVRAAARSGALKYGALAQPSGRLAIAWAPQGDSHIRLHWTESGVTLPQHRTRRGYGSQLIEEALPYQLRTQTRLEFKEDGIRCEIVVPARNEGSMPQLPSACEDMK